MSELWAQFERRYAGGATVAAELRQPSTGFSVTVLLGPSGCGKTTVLRCLAGLERPESGSIRWEDEVWFDAARRIVRSPQQRGVGFLFQEYALFPHLTVAENIAYGLDALPAAARRARVDQLLHAFAVSELSERRPRQISGGQQQRVALARTLAVRPRLLLLDEPLTSLDPPLREQMRRELRELLREFQVPTLLVTHDRLEAMSLGDRVIVMDQGSVRQAGTVLDVFSKPVDATVAKMVGIETVVPATVVRAHEGLVVLRIGAVDVTAVAPRDVATNVMACIRAEEVVVEKSAATGTSMRNQLPGRITSLTPEGPLVRVGVDCGFALTALVTRPAASELALAVGDSVWVGIKAPAIHVIPR